MSARRAALYAGLNPGGHRWRMQRVRCGAALIAAAFTLACGGGGGTSESPIAPSSPRAPALHGAQTMSQLIDQIRTAYGYSFDSLKAYDHGVNEYPAARMFLQTDDPLAGTFLAYQLATYPTPSGRATLSASDGSRKASYSAMDLTNGLVIEGQYQAFWGIQDVATQNNLTYVPFALLTEGIVTLGGVPKYRAMQSLTGRIYRNRVVVDGVDITPRILMLSGAYEAVNVETFDSTDARVPCLFGACRLSYQAVWLKQ